MKQVIVGGGLAGLVAAATLLRQVPGKDILILEREVTLGGLLAGAHYPEQGLYFDRGTHLFRETGVTEIDALLQKMAGEENIRMFSSSQGGHAGAIYQGRLQHNSHFPDVRQHPDRQAMLDEVWGIVAGTQPIRPITTFEAIMDVAEPVVQASRIRAGRLCRIALWVDPSGGLRPTGMADEVWRCAVSRADRGT
jgi:ribulose 1,5-bisphosphate synthetase/thiazole synthase